MRVGHGYDVHRLVCGRQLILGGVALAHPQGLLGHSDADVLAHAVMDALLGAAGLGDIGRHFPDTSQEYAGADSLQLLARVGWLLAAEGWQVSNIDATIVAEAPKLAAFLPQMASNIAGALGICAAKVNVKATTEEGLGLCGHGIGAHAVALILGLESDI